MLRFLWLVLSTLLLTGLAQAGNVNFNGNVSGCTRDGDTYTCDPSFLGANDTAVIGNGKTVIVTGAFQLGYFQGLKMSDTARLETTGSNDINLSGAQVANIDVSGGTIQAGNFVRDANNNLSGGGNFLITNGQSVTANVLGNTVSTDGSSATIRGNVTAVTVNMRSSATVTGAVYCYSLTTGSSNVIGGGATVRDQANLGSGIKLSGGLSAGTITTGSPAELNGPVVSKGTIALGSGTVVNGNLSGTEITTTSSVTLTGTITATKSFNLASGSTVTGNITSPTVVLASSSSTIKGDISASTSLDIGSSVVVTGKVDAGTLAMRAEGAKVNGNVTLKGDFLMESGTTINGDLVAARVTTKSSNATINGNAAVNYIYLDGGATVSKVITCTGPGAAGCSCVERPSWYNYNPTCAAAPAAGAHHFQITHTGSALTCQPQTVKVTACANAACTAPHFTGSSSVTLQPGAKSFTFTGETSSATVEQTTVGVATLAATGTTGTTCVNSANTSASNQCAMSFEDTGLQVTVDNHIAATTANVRIQALAATANKQSCVPLVAGKTESINLSCGFANPVSGKARAGALVSVNGNGLTCGNSPTKLQLAFDSAGIANTTLTYPEVGEVSLDAAYAGSAGYTARGSGKFIAAPARFTIEATSASGKKVAAGTVPDANSAIFAKAGETFTVKFSAVNNKGEVTTNFGKETTAENMKLALPAVDNPADAGNAGGDITTGAMNAITDGVSSSKTDSTGAWSFSDVGIIRLDLGLNSGAGYLGAAGDQFKTAGTQKIGRFIPDHFDTSLPIFATLTGSRTREMVAPGQLAGMTMPCKATSNSTPLLSPCDPVFIYSYQPFYVIVKAYNSVNGLTLNYQGSLAKPITLSAAATLGGATLVDTNVGAMGASIPGTAPLFTFVKGLGRVDDANFDLPSTISMPMFRFKALPSAATGSNPVRFFVRAVDTDGATSQRATASSSMETAITAVSGRLVVPNIDGSPTSPMPVTLQAQFYDASRGFMFNPMYNAPVKSLAGYLRFNNCQKGLSSVCATAAQLQPVAPGTAAFQSGKAGFRLTPPSGQYGLGSVELTVDPQWIYYLPSTTGKLAFGLYRSGPVIYTREIY